MCSERICSSGLTPPVGCESKATRSSSENCVDDAISVPCTDRKPGSCSAYTYNMTTTLLAAWQTRTATDVAALDSELREIITAVRAFKARAAKVTRRVRRIAEQQTDAVYLDHEAAQQDDVESQAMSASQERLLEQLADLPSGDPADHVGGALESLASYRTELAALAWQVAKITS